MGRAKQAMEPPAVQLGSGLWPCPGSQGLSFGCGLSSGRGMIAQSRSRWCYNAYQPGLNAEVLKHSQDELWFLLAMQEVLTND